MDESTPIALPFSLSTTLTGHSQAVTAVQFSHDGTVLLSGCESATECLGHCSAFDAQTLCFSDCSRGSLRLYLEA
jgi:WD40 repeat protein